MFVPMVIMASLRSWDLVLIPAGTWKLEHPTCRMFKTMLIYGVGVKLPQNCESFLTQKHLFDNPKTS